MAKSRGRTFFPVNINIPTLAGGVGKQDPSKRLATESEDVDNFILSVEKSAEKRMGISPISTVSLGVDTKTGLLLELSDSLDSGDANLWYHWFKPSADKYFLIVIDMGNQDTSFNKNNSWVYSLNSDNEIEYIGQLNAPVTGDTVYNENRKMWEYLSYNPENKEASECLYAFTIGSSLIIINKEVYAGFSSSGNTDNVADFLKDFGGVPYTAVSDPEGYANVDYLGIPTTYETSVTVDASGFAEVWTAYSDYISGEVSIDREDTHPEDDTKHGLWRVPNFVSIIVGPEGEIYNSFRPSNQLSYDQANLPIRYSVQGVDSDQTENVSMEVQGMSGGTSSTKAIGSIQLKYRENTDDSDSDNDNWIIPGVNQALPINWEQAVEIWNSENSWDSDGWTPGQDGSAPAISFTATDLIFGEETFYDADRPILFRYIRLSTTIPQGDVRFFTDDGFVSYKASWHTLNNSPPPDTSNGATLFPYLVTLGIQGCNSFGDIVNALWAGLNKLKWTENGDDPNEYPDAPRWFTWLNYEATPNTTGTGLDISALYYPEQWIKECEDPEKPWHETNNPQVYTEYIKASDYYYPDPDKKYLGQAVAKFSDLKFPPTESSYTARNSAEDIIKSLYPESGDEDGRGKVYYLDQEYQGASEGHYRVISLEKQPYLEKLRTPDNMGLLDRFRMPKQIAVDEEGNWLLRHIGWDMRDTGSKQTNPGPSIFHDGEGNTKESQIKAGVFYRDRLFLASNDTLFSSRLGDWDNLWMDNPDSMKVTDPLDLTVTSTSYTPIRHLKPYRSFLFLGTSGDVQYELLGSENIISPLTAEVSPTSFYGMTEHTEPVLMNNSLFFFGKKKLYIYFGEQSDTHQQAVELTSNCPGYLPENPFNAVVSTDTNKIVVLDKDKRNKLYVYTNRIMGEEIVQNAFSTLTLSEDIAIESMTTMDDKLLMVLKQTDNETDYLSCVSLSLQAEDLETPRLDHVLLYNGTAGGSSDALDISSMVYDADTDTTNILIRSSTHDLDTLIIWDYYTNDLGYKGEEIEVVSSEGLGNSYGVSDDLVRIGISGNWVNILETTTFYIGKKYEASIELSPQFVRGEQGEVANGVLNLRYGLFRYFNSGAFTVEISRENRDKKEYQFNIDYTDDREGTIDFSLFKNSGVFKVPILGFSSDITMKIVSDSISPLTLSSIEFTGKFKKKIKILGD
jgi:hypothetical protein